MCCTKSIVHIDIAELGGIVGLFANVKAAVFKQNDLALVQLNALDPIFDQGNRAMKQFGQSFCHG